MLDDWNSEALIAPAPGEPCSIAMLVLPNFNIMAAQAFIDPFRAANYLKGRTIYLWPWLSLDGANVAASNGISLGPTISFSKLQSPLTKQVRTVCCQGLTIVHASKTGAERICA